jgi:hypothetical protein
MTRKPKRASGKAGQVDWAKQLRFDMEYMKARVLEDGSMPPTFIVHTPTTIIPVLTNFDDKERSRSLVTLVCVAHAAIGVTFMGEAWMKNIWGQPEARQRPGESWQQWEQRIGVPSESETRVEVVIVQSTFYDDDTGDKAGMAEMREILRNAAGKAIGFGDPIAHQHSEAGDQEIRGPTFNILPDRRASPADQELAKAALEALGIIARPLGGRAN